MHRCTFAAKVETLLADLPEPRAAIAPLLEARNMMRKKKKELDALLGKHARKDPVCKRLMTIPGVGPIISLAICRASIHSAHVSAHQGILGLNNLFIKLVGAAGFEPAAPCSQICCSSMKINGHSEAFMHRSGVAGSTT